MSYFRQEVTKEHVRSMPNKKENGDINYIVRPSLIKKTLKESGRQYIVNKVYLQKARHYRWHGGDPLL